MLKVKDLRASEYNPRQITDKKLDMLGKSMKEFGDLGGVIFNKQTGNLIGGHQRIKHLDPEWEIEKIAEDRGYIITPFGKWDYREVDWPQKKEITANIAANRHGGEFDMIKLKDLIVEIDDGSLDMELTGFEDSELQDIFGYEKKGLIEDDEVPEVKEAISKTGDLWLLGEHRVLCGDATKKEDVERLMNGKKADMVFADPPYNYDYDYGKYDDDKAREQYIAFTKNWYSYAKIFSKRILVTPGTKNLSIYYQHFNPLWMCVWLKKNAMTASKIGNLSIWEPILLEDDDWDYEPILFEGRPIKKVKRDVYEFNVKKQKEVGNHPCPKLFDFWENLLIDFSEENNIILDPFLGSGTTIVVSEQTNRICYGMEIDPHYCDVIVNRWETFTGKKGILERSPNKDTSEG